MIIIEKYRLIADANDSNKYYVKSEEESICPICSNIELKVIGSRNRVVLNNSAEKLVLVIRRFRCSRCGHVHHELPDMLVPYKRYSSASIETIIDNTRDEVACECSSIYRIKKWFQSISEYIAGCLSSIAAQMGIQTEIKLGSALQRIKGYAGKDTGWLARTVRTLANTNNWVHTRSAFMS
ncbi:MAG: DUF6431 domain-containing protein [Desulfitobacteriaceae bacterium]|jgi:hypothetical protein|nr:DUF6431 domain-containing protein [Desulfitobacteriaceae bacterium]